MKKFAEEKMAVAKGDVLITGENSAAVIIISDGSSIVIEQNSKFKVNDESVYEQEEGKVYYNIEKREQRGIEVKTPFAVIGVKGTEFIVNSVKDNQSVALKKGLLNIESLKEQFELHRKEEKSAFEAFIEKTKSAFTDYKEKQKKDFVEFVNEFELEPDKMVSFSDNVVKENEINTDLEKEFEKFRAYL
jgi:ferric-dicitrate binding protein FerR (iron transport regulator)